MATHETFLIHRDQARRIGTLPVLYILIFSDPGHLVCRNTPCTVVVGIGPRRYIEGLCFLLTCQHDRDLDTLPCKPQKKACPVAIGYTGAPINQQRGERACSRTSMRMDPGLHLPRKIACTAQHSCRQLPAPSPPLNPMQLPPITRIGSAAAQANPTANSCSASAASTNGATAPAQMCCCSRLTALARVSQAANRATSG